MTTDVKVGPWAVQHTAGHETHGQTAVYDESTGKDVAIVYDGEAHAAVIAAAPELLSAAEDALESLKRLPDFDGAYRITCITQLKAAISKARGL